MFSHGKLITILQYFTNKIDDYWHILYPLTDKKEREGDEYLYFYDISQKALDYKGEFSEDGIYLFKGYDGKYHLHPLELAQYALACCLAWKKTEDDIWLSKALLHCDWLVKNQESDGAWRVKHKNPIYFDLPSPWSSTLTQAFAISSLTRIYHYTRQKKYLHNAQKACNFLETDILNGGARREFDGVFIYEEYPRIKLSGVLNGYISTLFAIYELSLVDETYKNLYHRNILNLKKILPKYDLGYWSLYSLDGNIASGFYHRLLVKQLKVLSELDDDFKNFYKIHLKYQDNKYYAFKALWFKIKSRV